MTVHVYPKSNFIPNDKCMDGGYCDGIECHCIRPEPSDSWYFLLYVYMAFAAK